MDDAIKRLERSTWDSRVIPSKADVSAMLAELEAAKARTAKMAGRIQYLESVIASYVDADAVERVASILRECWKVNPEDALGVAGRILAALASGQAATPIASHPLDPFAQGMAARSDATGTGAAEGNSPVGNADAPEPQQG